jgi:hypothetical protein
LALIWIEAETEAVPSKLSPQSGISAQSVNRWHQGVCSSARGFSARVFDGYFYWGTVRTACPRLASHPPSFESVLHSSWKSQGVVVAHTLRLVHESLLPSP